MSLPSPSYRPDRRKRVCAQCGALIPSAANSLKFVWYSRGGTLENIKGWVCEPCGLQVLKVLER